MADEPLVRGLRALWQAQPEGGVMSIEEVRDRSLKLQEESPPARPHVCRRRGQSPHLRLF